MRHSRKDKNSTLKLLIRSFSIYTDIRLLFAPTSPKIMTGITVFTHINLLTTEDLQIRFIICQKNVKPTIQIQDWAVKKIANSRIQPSKDFITLINTRLIHVNSLERREKIARRVSSVLLYTLIMSRDIYRHAIKWHSLIDLKNLIIHYHFNTIV